MTLTDPKCRNAKCPRDRGFVRLADGKGMYLEVRPTGGKYWRMKYRYGGKEKLLALGVFPEVSLKDARKRRDAARERLADGIDPSTERREQKIAKQAAAANSFEAVARTWWEQWRSGKTERHATYVIRRLEDDAFPEIGERPVRDIQSPDIVAMLKKIEARGANDIAKRVYQMGSQVMRYAIAHGLATRNPFADFKPSDVLRARKKENFARIDAKELPELLRKIEAYDGAAATRFALQLMAHTFVRTAELIAAKWDEFDLEAAEWRIPAERMKMRTPHIVPLSAQSVALLRELQAISGHREHLFPGERNPRKPMSNNTILYALYRMGYHSRMTGHGFRGVASTLLHELGHRHDWIELQLAHQERNAVSAAYNHAQHLGGRRKMMQAWSDHLEGLQATGKITPLKRKTAA